MIIHEFSHNEIKKKWSLYYLKINLNLQIGFNFDAVMIEYLLKEKKIFERS